MTQTIATREAPLTPAAILANGLRSDEFKQQIAAALPPTVTADRFIRVALTAIQTNDDIAECDRNSVVRAFIRCATDGLMPDGREAAIVKRRRKIKGQNGRDDSWINEASYMQMIDGDRKKLAEHGWTLRTAVVYANDEFDHAVVDGEEIITHRPVRPGADRGSLIASYAIAKHRDGRKLISVLHPDDIAKRRESAQTQNVWDKHEAAMWEKSAGHDVYDQVGLAEVDAERDRLADAIALLGGDDPARTLYGHRRDQLPELPAVSSPEPHQQADGPAAQESVPDVEPSVPGAEADEEPQVGETTVATGDEAVSVAAAASVASTFEIPNGKNRGQTLAEVHSSGEDGIGWLGWALKKIGWPSPETEGEQQFRDAVWAFCRVHEPDLYQSALATKQAEGLI